MDDCKEKKLEELEVPSSMETSLERIADVLEAIFDECMATKEEEMVSLSRETLDQE